MAAVVVVAVAVVVGVGGRVLRASGRSERLAARAAEAAARQTYDGYLTAEALLSALAADGPPAAGRAALARITAAIAFEFGELVDEAKARVAKVADDSGRDATLARAYLALATTGDEDASRRARDAVERLPGDAEAAYVLGRTLLAAGDPAAALDVLRRSAATGALPFVAVAMAEASWARGEPGDALAAVGRALERLPGHPAALIEQARLFAATSRAVSGTDPEAELAQLIGGKDRNGSSVRVASSEIAWANLALAELRSARGDVAGAARALEAARSTSVSCEPRLIGAVVAALLAAGDLAAARDVVARAAETWPRRTSVHLWRARLALAEGKPDAALAEVDRLGAGAALPGALAVRGRARLALGDLAAAAKDLDEALAAFPADAVVLGALGEVDLRRGDARSAVARAERAYTSHPEPAVAVVLGAALRAAGDATRARSVLSAVGQGSVDSMLELARLDRETGRFDDARKEYATVIERAPTRIEVQVEVATLLYDLGDAAGGLAALDALERDRHGARDARDAPANAGVLLEAARLACATGDLAGAARRIDAAAAVGNTALAGKLERERGRLALARREPEAAARALEAAVRACPEDAEAWLLRLDAALAQNGGRAVTESLAEVSRRFRGLPEVDLARGRVELANGRLGAAITAFAAAQKALESRGAAARLLSDAQAWLGRARYYGGDLPGAERALVDAARLDAGNAEAHHYLGLLLMERNDLAGARAAFERAVAANKAFADAHFYLGDCARRLGDGEAARSAFATYLTLAPRGEYAREALGYTR